ncbi:MAG: T9SS type A sorting domain-containing protein [Bacteroidales bacterium]|nr:T9SS type A sorting domain-containing protein [Bacteroidales bacterium]MCF8454945.1 T9SS type A sorting domain-containing protein [Bacteroidales bacterium]
MNKLILIIGFLTANLILIQAQVNSPFVPVDPTGIPYSIVISGAGLNNGSLPDSTEIAVFDDTLCVGTVLFLDSGNIQLVAWQGDPSQSLEGFSQGHPMSFKAGLVVGSTVYVEEAVPTFSVGNGNFGYGSFSVISLQVTSVIVGMTNIDEPKQISIYPNPFSDFIHFYFEGKVCNQIEFFDISGKLLSKEIFHQGKSKMNIPAGKIIVDRPSTQMILVKIHCADEIIIRKLIYQGAP